MFPVLRHCARASPHPRIGTGEIVLASLVFGRASRTYKRALVSQIYPRNRAGLVLESNLGLVNTDEVSRDDRDATASGADSGRPRPAFQNEEKGVDWRTKFEYKPNEIYWSDGAVLKSDTVREDRAPDSRERCTFA